MAPICLSVAFDHLRCPESSTEELSNLDSLYTFHISGKVV